MLKCGDFHIFHASENNLIFLSPSESFSGIADEKYVQLQYSQQTFINDGLHLLILYIEFFFSFFIMALEIHCENINGQLIRVHEIESTDKQLG